MLEINFKVSGIDKVAAKVERMQETTDDLRPTMRDVVYPWLLEHARRQWASEGKYGGNGWTPISDGWIAHKLRKGKPRQILRYTDTYRKAATRKDHKLQSLEMTRKQLKISINLPYARAQQKAGRDPWERKRKQRAELASMIRKDIRRRIERG